MYNFEISKYKSKTSFQNMSLISITCEKNFRDYLISSLKASILSKVPNIAFLDITRQIEPFETVEAALTLRNTFQLLPEGSIHFIFVQNIIDTENPPLVFKYANHFFVTADNGFVSLFLQDDEPQEIIRMKPEMFISPFSEINYYPEIVKQIIDGIHLNKIGSMADEYKEHRLPKPFFEENAIKGMVLFFDPYQNVVSNITTKDFEKYRNFNHFEISLQYADFKIKRINQYYHQVLSGEVFALFNRFNLLEIGQYNGKIKEIYNLSKQTRVSIEFYD